MTGNDLKFFTNEAYMPAQKTLNRYFEKLDKDLVNKNYGKLLIHLRLLGRSFENWDTPCSATALLKNFHFRNSLIQNEQTDLTDQEILAHQEKLRCLIRVLLAWDDTSLPRVGESPEGENQKKRRQTLKFKTQINKDDRRALRLGLSALALHLTAKETDSSLNLNNTYDLIQWVSEQITIKKLTDEKLEQNELEKIGRAIKSFQTPNKKKKLIKYTGIFLALIASLACGLSTGGAIILLFPSFSILAFTLGGIIALFGFTANFGFFSQNFPDFLLSLFKKGGVSEYIDNEGKRKQFSAIYIYLLTPLAIVASLTVGIGTTAITYFTILQLVIKLLPILTIIWPPLPILIVSILSVSIGITLTVAVLTATLESLKKVATLNMDFKTLSQYVYNHCIEWFKNLKNLKTHEKVGLVIMLLLIPIALAGLAYYRYTAGIDLSIFIGMAGSIVMGVVAYIAQIAFTCLSVNKLKNALIKPFASTTTQQVIDNQDSKSLVKSVFSNIWYVFGLLVNAIGNSVLVYDGSSVSIAGAVSCGLNSFTGNMSEPDMNQHNRKAATIALVSELKSLNISIIRNNTQKEAALASTSETDEVKLKNFTGFPSERSKPIPIKTSSAPTTPTDEHSGSPIDSKNVVENNHCSPQFFRPETRTTAPHEKSLIVKAKH